MEEQIKIDCARCGRDECVFRSVNNMINNMKRDIMGSQNVPYHEQIVVAEIYYITVSTLAEACRRFFKVELKNCDENEKHRNPTVTLDTFILLKQLKDDGLLSEEYGNELFDVLIKMSPELEQQVRKDRESGIL